MRGLESTLFSTKYLEAKKEKGREKEVGVMCFELGFL